MFDVDSQSDLHADEAMEERLVPHHTTSHMSVGLEEPMRLRNAAQADKPLARTLKWVASLPPDVKPTALLRRYARIANVIAATWGHATSLRSYMDCLFSEKRGIREGFPPEVLSELVALKRYHDTLEMGSFADQATISH